MAQIGNAPPIRGRGGVRRGGIMARDVMGGHLQVERDASGQGPSGSISPPEAQAAGTAGLSEEAGRGRGRGGVRGGLRGRGRGRGVSDGVPAEKRMMGGEGGTDSRRMGRGRGQDHGSESARAELELSQGLDSMIIAEPKGGEGRGRGRGRGKHFDKMHPSSQAGRQVEEREPLGGDNMVPRKEENKLGGGGAGKTGAAANKQNSKPRFDAKHASMRRDREENELLDLAARAMQEFGVHFRPNCTLMDGDKVEQLQKGGKVHVGALRVNGKKPLEAFVSCASFQKDIFVPSISLRGTALDQDRVAVAILPRTDPHKEQEQAVVVAVVERRHKKRFLGRLLLEDATGDAQHLLFKANDGRMPAMAVEAKDCPREILTHPEGGKQLLVAEVETWEDGEGAPWGRLVECMGMAGDLMAETNGLLVEHGIEKEPIPDHMLPDHLRECVVHGVSEEEAARRRDCRGERVCSIDPTTAKDLDDALHVKMLSGAAQALPGEAVMEVGVHIADVSFFVRAGTELDAEAKKRATSTYLVQGCIPMLPHALCEDMCSLNPHCDRLAFSVIWRFDREGHVVSEWFGRSVIRNKCRLNYDTAQRIIEAAESSPPQPTPPFPPEYRPEGGAAEEAQVAEDVLALHRLAQTLRQRRFDGGAVTINQGKIYFRLEDGLPVEVMESKQESANRLVEEFMLLANQSVAQKVSRSYPERALLRNHPPPKVAGIAKLQELCRGLGLSLESGSSHDLQSLLRQVAAQHGAGVALAVTQQAALSMNLATYLRAGSVSQGAWRHFALAMDHYTHFTSPIRRYPDCVVHRQLYAALLEEGSEAGDLQWAREQGLVEGEGPLEELDETCEHCNARKWAAKAAQEASTQVNLVAFLLKEREAGREVVMEGLVTSMGTYTFTVLVPALNIDKQVDNRDFEEPHPERAAKGPKGKGLLFRWEKAGGSGGQAGRGRGRGGGKGASQSGLRGGGGQGRQWVVNVFDAVHVKVTVDNDCIPAELKFVVQAPDGVEHD